MKTNEIKLMVATNLSLNNLNAKNRIIDICLPFTSNGNAVIRLANGKLINVPEMPSNKSDISLSRVGQLANYINVMNG